MADVCRVRPLESRDLPELLAWRNHASVRQFMINRHTITPDEHQNWFNKVQLIAGHHLLIAEDGEQALGYVQFSQAHSGGVADWGFYAQPGAARGSGTRLCTAALDHAFGVLKVHKVCGHALANNLASLALHAKLGFEKEGVLREQHMHDGVRQHLVVWGLLARDWQGPSRFAESHP